jgi:hypothetical protein
MGFMYTNQFENQAISTIDDFFELTPADDRPMVIHAIYIDQISDVGDSEEEMLRWAIIRGHTTGGSGGTANEFPLHPNAPAAAGVIDALNTTIASGGTTQQIHAGAFNSRAGLIYIPTPECRPIVNQGNTTLVVRLVAAPGDSMNMSGTIYVEEL